MSRKFCTASTSVESRRGIRWIVSKKSYNVILIGKCRGERAHSRPIRPIMKNFWPRVLRFCWTSFLNEAQTSNNQCKVSVIFLFVFCQSWKSIAFISEADFSKNLEKKLVFGFFQSSYKNKKIRKTRKWHKILR